MDPDKLAGLQVQVTIKEDKVIYDADTASQGVRSGTPFVSDPEAAHELLVAFYKGIDRLKD